jgi:hypothetical protein
MLKFSLVVLFLMSMAALTAAASALPVPPEGTKSTTTLVATLS